VYAWENHDGTSAISWSKQNKKRLGVVRKISVKDTLLATKIRIPPFRSNLVTRSHLIQRLNDGISQIHRLTLISAPAGYGKSTILSEWVSQINLPVAWLSLEKGENNPVRFWGYFVTALSTLPRLDQVSLDESFLHALQSPQPPPMDLLLVGLVNDLSKLEVGVVLVLDDLHSIIEGQIHQDLVFLIDHLPQSSHGLHLVVASRMDPPWPLARWRGRGELAEVRSSDLRFSYEEIYQCVLPATGQLHHCL
jgi:LuxR family maltose regulon positive regulatory protein